MKRSLLQARLEDLSHQQKEFHLKEGTNVATQVPVKNESPNTQLLVLQGKRDTEESLNVTKENLNYNGYQQESCGWEESPKESSVRITTLGHMGLSGDGSMYFTKDKY
jgi:hypothetical protein